MALKCSLNKAGVAAALLLGPPGGARAEAPAEITRARWLMGTVCEITALGARAPEGVEAAFAEIDRLDRLMSLYKGTSELTRVNRQAARAPMRVSEDLWRVLLRSAGVWRLSEGAFDPAVGSAGRFDRVRLDASARSVRFKTPLRIDPGGIGKGYALDAAAAAMRRVGVRSALLNFGGQLLALGSPPGGGGWEVGLPSGVRLSLRDASVSSSSQDEQPGHILDPRTGLPVKRTGFAAVAAPNAASADAWSTALFVLGLDRTPAAFRHCALAGGRTPEETLFAGDCRPYLNSKKGRRPRHATNAPMPPAFLRPSAARPAGGPAAPGPTGLQRSPGSP